MQVMVWEAENGAGRKRYVIHPLKSHTLIYQSSKNDTAELSIFLNGSGVDITDRAVHLGTMRDTSNRVDSGGKIPLERKTTLSLMWAGLHGVGA